MSWSNLDTVKLSAFAKKFYSEPFTLNEIPEEYISRNNGVMLISSGKIHQANEGCACTMNSILKQFIKHLTVGENVMLKRIINNLILHREDVVLLDMEAGLEHLGRGITEGMDQFIVVIEPGARSVQTYRNVKRLAEELGVKKVRVVANYAIFTVLLSEGDTTITLLCERVNSTTQFCKLLKEIYCYMIT